MRVAIIAWGSLIWDKKELQISNDWNEEGVTLPIEFARVSKDERLTLVITEEHGTHIETYWALSYFSNMDDAIENLRKREGTNKNGIGFISLDTGESHSQFSHGIIKKITEWAKSKEIDGVIWTDLGSNFEQKTNSAFTIESALKYLDSLEGELKLRATEYIKKAPELTNTELRKMVNASA